MAEQRSSPKKMEPWLMEHILGLVKQSDNTEKSSLSTWKLKNSAREQLLAASETDREKFERFENNHPNFFQSPIQFKMFDPTIPLRSENEKIMPTGADIAGFARVTAHGIATWVREDLQKKGIIFGLLQTKEKEHPGLGKNLAETNENRHKSLIAALLQAIAGDALVLSVPDGVDATGLFKLEIACSVPDQILPIHLVANIGKSANVRLMIDYQPGGKNVNRTILMLQSDFHVDENAEFRVFHHQHAHLKTMVLVDEKVVQEKLSRTEIFSLDTGAAGLERELSVEFKGEGAESTVTGVYRPGAGSKYFFDTEQIHNASNSVSDLQYNGVLGEHAYTSWKGNIRVGKKTGGTNSYQSNKNLILDETAKVESVPGLEILTDDVRCSHGVTIGNIDKNHMFYLQSRGINEEEAESLIIDGFLRSSIKRIKSSSFFDLISQSFKY